jgi:hypothetical protein
VQSSKMSGLLGILLKNVFLKQEMLCKLRNLLVPRNVCEIFLCKVQKCLACRKFFYESSEVTKRLVYYPRNRGFIQRSNAEF